MSVLVSYTFYIPSIPTKHLLARTPKGAPDVPPRDRLPLAPSPGPTDTSLFQCSSTASPPIQLLRSQLGIPWTPLPPSLHLPEHLRHRDCAAPTVPGLGHRSCPLSRLPASSCAPYSPVRSSNSSQGDWRRQPRHSPAINLKGPHPAVE